MPNRRTWYCSSRCYARMTIADYQADSSAYGFHVVREVASPAVTMLYDIYHMAQIGEDILADHRGKSGHHLAHPRCRDCRSARFPCPAVPIDYPALIASVTEAGYQGYWGLEFIPRGEVMEELRQISRMKVRDELGAMVGFLLSVGIG